MYGQQGEVSGFLRADGQRLVNGEGREVLLRGVGFGGWLLPEGYMWRFPEEGDRPRRIERMIEQLIGKEKAARFWHEYYNAHTAEADIRRIAEEGFNSVRLPINARFLIEEEEPLRLKPEHLQLLDRMIGWCKQYGLYVILDLHGAPGGQTGTNIDDSERDLPELFVNEGHRKAAVELWAALAERYKDEWIVAGYDLLNEPLPEWFNGYNDRIMPLYKEMTEAIRRVDRNHMIILEGAHWATDWSIFDEKFDDNLMLQFHKYWNNPDQASIQQFLDKREEWNVPIFMGEGGENNLEWYVGAFGMYEDLKVSWNFWTWKKIDTNNSPCSIRKPANWQLLVDYLQGGSKPNAEEAEAVLREFLSNMRLENCDYYQEVVNALFRRPPLRYPAIFYGHKGQGVSYGLQNAAKCNIGFRQEDGTDIRFIRSLRTEPNFQHGGGEPWAEEDRLLLQAHTGDWFNYEFNVYPENSDASKTLLLCIRAAAPEGNAKIEVTVNEREKITLDVVSQAWSDYEISGELNIGPGRHVIGIKALDHPVQLDWLDIKVNTTLKS
ncbi:cellulase family glycosylhydrolase [Paenibacillus sp. M1]|uniref:Cellulase family glycosylhydrolase n=1 Tax=Paenibacillus haidiansis TaxID=1574488 RepID=A0ABU7VL50_9BACL